MRKSSNLKYEGNIMNKENLYFDNQYNSMYNNEEESEFEKLNQQKFVTFSLDDQYFGIKVENVIEVLPIQEITPVVHTPQFIKGVLNLRGQIICVLDLKLFFNLDFTELNENAKIIFVTCEDKTAGLLVDQINKIYVDKDPTLESIPATVTGKMSELLSGVVNVNYKPLMIINLKNLFTSEELNQFE
jgi:purine-binding chemotaxis protein CheW